MHITQEVVYTLPTDGIIFSTVVGSEIGRVFMGAKDGCLYEFVYHVSNGWIFIIILYLTFFNYFLPIYFLF